jgi:hypothetical protein
VDPSLIDPGLAALRDGETVTARHKLELALTEGERGDVLAGLGEALYLDRDYSASASFYERAYSAYRSEGNQAAACYTRGGRRSTVRFQLSMSSDGFVAGPGPWDERDP